MRDEKRRPAPAATGAQGESSGKNHGQGITSASPADALLGRLERVRTRGEGRWLARCPAHADASPSLAIRETGDGRLLVHCFAGCATADVLAAVSLELADLFPDQPRERTALRKSERWVPRDVLTCVANEALVCAVAAEDVARGVVLNDADLDRLHTAVGRLNAAAREAGDDG